MLIAVLAVSPQDANRKQARPEINGYLKDLQALNFAPKPDSFSSLNLFHNRLQIHHQFSSVISARFDLRTRLFWGDQLRQVPDFNKSIDRYEGLVDLSLFWLKNKTLIAHTVIDRMLIQYQKENWDVTLGRQRINWGVHTIWNPNDIFNAYNFLDFDYEERPGTDALRIQRFFKKQNTLELAVKPGSGHDFITGVLYKFNRKKIDWQLLAGIYRRDLVAGGGWAGSIKKAGFKGELSYFHPRSLRQDSGRVISFSVMADQTFKNDWYVSLAALYNSRPSEKSMIQQGFTGGSPDAKNLMPFRYNFYAGISKAFSPIATARCAMIYAPHRNSLILFPQLTWNAATNLDVDLTALSFFYRGSHRYQSQGTSLFLRGKWSF